MITLYAILFCSGQMCGMLLDHDPRTGQPFTTVQACDAARVKILGGGTKYMGYDLVCGSRQYQGWVVGR